MFFSELKNDQSLMGLVDTILKRVNLSEEDREIISDLNRQNYIHDIRGTKLPMYLKKRLISKLEEEEIEIKLTKDVNRKLKAIKSLADNLDKIAFSLSKLDKMMSNPDITYSDIEDELKNLGGGTPSVFSDLISNNKLPQVLDKGMTANLLSRFDEKSFDEVFRNFGSEELHQRYIDSGIEESKIETLKSRLDRSKNNLEKIKVHLESIQDTYNDSKKLRETMGESLLPEGVSESQYQLELMQAFADVFGVKLNLRKQIMVSQEELQSEMELLRQMIEDENLESLHEDAKKRLKYLEIITPKIYMVDDIHQMVSASPEFEKELSKKLTRAEREIIKTLAGFDVRIHRNDMNKFRELLKRRGDLLMDKEIQSLLDDTEETLETTASEAEEISNVLSNSYTILDALMQQKEERN